MKRQRQNLLGWAALATLIALTGCKSSATELLVLIDSDYEEADVSTVTVEVSDLDGAALVTQTFDIGANIGFPFSFSIAQDSAGAVEFIDLDIIARDPNGDTLSTRRIRTGFVKNEILLLPVYLPTFCRNLSCPFPMTCSERGCISPTVETSTLQGVEPGAELSHDAGTPIAPDGAIVDLGDQQTVDGATPRDADPTTDAGFEDVRSNPDGQIVDSSARDVGPIDAGVPHCLDTPCAQGQTCVNVIDAAPCGARGEVCACRQTCDPFGPQVCAQGDACRWIDRAQDDRGACLPVGGGLEAGMACTARWDNGRIVDDTCNASRNLVCKGIGPRDNTGVCSPLCRPTTDQCGRLLPNTVCAAQSPDFTALGHCVTAPIPPASNELGNMCEDIGFECMQGYSCFGFEDTKVGLGRAGGCSMDCDDLTPCPTGAVCVRHHDGTAKCVAPCTGNSCASVNSEFLCNQIGTRSVCLPSCDIIQCGAFGICNMNSGRCE